MLNKNYRAFYKLDWVNENFDLKARGQEAVVNLLFDKYENELGEIAQKEVSKLKEKENTENFTEPNNRGV